MSHAFFRILFHSIVYSVFQTLLGSSSIEWLFYNGRGRLQSRDITASMTSRTHSAIFNMAGKFVIHYLLRNLEFSTIWMVDYLILRYLRFSPYERLILRSLSEDNVFKNFLFRMKTH